MKVKVSAVSYLNTLPFLYGITHSDVNSNIELSLDIPSVCATKLLRGEVDLGLIPVAVLPQLKEYHIISDYCIGADGKVDSVALFSDVPLNEIESVFLDYQSKTSINLVQILAEKYWKITPNWIDAEKGFEDQIQGKTAGVIIGDRTFHLSKSYRYQYDLAEEWQKFTGLPFVFACWVSNKELPDQFIASFNAALNFGIHNMDKVVKTYQGNKITTDKLYDYLSNKISYTLDHDKQNAIEEFLNCIKMRKVLDSPS